MKGCIVGNSHLAALKLGWKEIAHDFPKIELDFFGSHRDSMMRTEVRDGRLVALDAGVRSKLQMTGGAPEIELARYDFFAIVGMGFGLHPALAIFESHAIPSFQAGDRQVISEAAFADAMSDSLRGSTAGHIYWLLYTETSAPILIIPQPLNAEGILSSVRRGVIYKKINRLGIEKQISDIYASASLAALSGHTDIIYQPPETVTSHIFTKDIYSDGSVRLNQALDRQHSEADHAHMNARYGQVMLREMIARINAAGIAPKSASHTEGSSPAAGERRVMDKPVPATALTAKVNAARQERKHKKSQKSGQSGEREKKPKSLWRRIKRKLLRRGP